MSENPPDKVLDHGIVLDLSSTIICMEEDIPFTDPMCLNEVMQLAAQTRHGGN